MVRQNAEWLTRATRMALHTRGWRLCDLAPPLPQASSVWTGSTLISPAGVCKKKEEGGVHHQGKKKSLSTCKTDAFESSPSAFQCRRG